jgi:hypothetical protein
VQHTKAVSNSDKLVFKYQQLILQNGKIVQLGNTNGSNDLKTRAA